MQFPIVFSGTVIKGKGRGKQLGFPTANLAVVKKSSEVLEGIFTAYTSIENKKYPSLVFIGKAETFDDPDWSYESYILDFDQDIYGSIVTIELLSKIRYNKKFTGVEELIQAIENDIKAARKYFAGIKR